MKSPRIIRPGEAVGLRNTSVSHLALRVPDVAATAAFYGQSVGLVLHGDLPDGGLRLGWGAGHHVLDLLQGPRGLDHYAFEVRDVGGLEAIHERLVSAGSTVRVLDGAVLDHAIGDAAGFETTDPDGNRVQFHSPVRRDGEATGATRRRPVKYQHITIGTTDIQPFLQFYTEVIGFRISDQLDDDRFAWMRSDRDHHTLAVVNVGTAGNVDHFSFDLAEWEDFKSWCDKLTDEDVPVAWGPGRHGPGNNLFIFFDDPAGNHIELSAEMEKFHDDRVVYVPRRWTPAPTTINLWGGQLATWRHLSRTS